MESINLNSVSFRWSDGVNPRTRTGEKRSILRAVYSGRFFLLLEISFEGLCKFWNSVGGIFPIPWAAKRAREWRKIFERCREFSLSALLAASYWLLARPFNGQKF